jgi:hypothetical protein
LQGLRRDRYAQRRPLHSLEHRAQAAHRLLSAFGDGRAPWTP